MCCEIASSLLHSPRLLLLDEPTIELTCRPRGDPRLSEDRVGAGHGAVDVARHGRHRTCARGVIEINHGRPLPDGPVWALRSAAIGNRAVDEAPPDEVISLDRVHEVL